MNKRPRWPTGRSTAPPRSGPDAAGASPKPVQHRAQSDVTAVGESRPGPPGKSSSTRFFTALFRGRQPAAHEGKRNTAPAMPETDSAINSDPENSLGIESGHPEPMDSNAGSSPPSIIGTKKHSSFNKTHPDIDSDPTDLDQDADTSYYQDGGASETRAGGEDFAEYSSSEDDMDMRGVEEEYAGDNGHISPNSSMLTIHSSDAIVPADVIQCFGCSVQSGKQPPPDSRQQTSQELSWCYVCNMHLCDECWKGALVHQNRTSEGRELPVHRKIDIAKYKIIEAVLPRSTPAQTSQQDNAVNEDSKWFGVTIQDTGNLQRDAHLAFTTRYHDIRLHSRSTEVQHPCLVSFIGETGGGKSSIVRALVKMQLSSMKSASRRFKETPVVGMLGQTAPTSSDVHLFPDPKTRRDTYPRLYADCEGLYGGNGDPLMQKNITSTQEVSKQKSSSDAKSRKLEGVRQTRVRGLRRWRLRNIQDDQKSRDWMVKHIYPRILFTFSDVVCYVTKNSQSLETIIVKLIEWGHSVLETSINQPILPGAIIVINALEVPSECRNPGDQYDLNGYTEWVLEKAPSIAKLCQNPALSAIRAYWESKTQKIENLKTLIHCYFSKFRIICIPHIRMAPDFVIEQYEALYNAIGEVLEVTRCLRDRSGLLWDWDELGRYLSYAHKHFASDHTKPFNFLHAAIQHHPVGATLDRHILSAALRLKQHRTPEDYGNIFASLAPFIASCLFLDVCRKKLPQKDETETILTNYKAQVLNAYDSFYSDFYPCAREGPKGRCANVATKHTKGHQYASGKMFAVGDYEASVNISEDGKEFWREIIDSYNNLLEFQTNSIPESDHATNAPTGPLAQQVTKHISAVELHKNILDVDVLRLGALPKETDFRGHDTRTGRFRLPFIAIGAEARSTAVSEQQHEPPSYLTCYGCLCFSPSITLSCGHLLCDRCSEDFSDTRDLTPTMVPEQWSGLPVGTVQCPFAKCIGTATIHKEAPQAAPRVLSLDGGGVRSIIQLKILATLEDLIGLEMPIQDFFDLVIGTSAGGIVALSLVKARMPIRQCIEMFREYAASAFTKRMGGSIAGLRILVEVNKQGRYRSGCARDLFKRIFGEDTRCFGEYLGNDLQTDSPSMISKTPFEPIVSNRPQGSVKVGVTMSSQTGRSYLVGNYNRPDFPQDIDSIPISRRSRACPLPKPNRYSYQFFRGNNRNTELKVWEAAMATTAAPRIFKPLWHKATHTTFVDGGLNFINPVSIADRERMLIWPQELHQHPDILLSLGTGFSILEGTDMESQKIPEGPEDSSPKSPLQYFQGLKDMVYHQMRQQLDGVG